MKTLALSLLTLSLGACAAAPEPEPREVWVIVQTSGAAVRAPVSLHRPVRVVQVLVEPLSSRK